MNFETTPLQLQPGNTIGPEGRFELEARLGRGGMGEVWRARDRVENSVVAVKVLDQATLQQFPEAEAALRQEARNAKRLGHRHIVRVHDIHLGVDEFLIVAMELIHGKTLRRHLEEQPARRGCSLAWVLENVLEPMTAALAYAHGEDIVHRDIKPENIMLGEDGTLKLIDFGLAYQVRHTTALLTRSIGQADAAEPINAWTQGYGAPEVLDGEDPKKAADIHSLACVIWELLCGNKELPFGINRSMQRRPDDQPRKPQKMADGVYEVLCWGFAFHPDDRPESVAVFRDGLAAVLGKPVVMPSPEPTPAPQSWSREPPYIHGWSTEAVQRLQRETAQRLNLPVAFRGLRDRSDGPEMMVIPAGWFLMGSPESEVERSDREHQHEVTIAQPFALASEALTFAWYDRFVKATNRRKPPEKPGFFGRLFGAKPEQGSLLLPSDRDWGRGDRPVIKVSCEDAVDFCAWLSEQTGRGYRLPTEAEWEYACRAGTTTAFWWGDTISTRQANHDGNFSYSNGSKGEYLQKTLPVRSFEPNPWGLYQMHGNVWEWTASDWSADYSGQELLPSRGGDSARVVRGGGWYYRPVWMRSAARRRFLARDTNYSGGCRLARAF